MKTCFRLDGGKASECAPDEAGIFLYNEPTAEEEKELIEKFGVDAHTLTSALDPDELSRLEFEDNHAALIFKKPKSYRADDNFLLRVSSCGAFLYADRLIVVVSDDSPLFEGRAPFVVRSLQGVVLRLLYQAILHFEGHLKAINMLSDSLEKRISASLENRYLLNMFALEKSLVYILNSIDTNRGLLERIRAAAGKMGLSEEDMEILDDIIIENTQCYRRAEIYSHVISGLMDARVSIVGNNLNHLMKKFTIVSVAIMLANLVVGLFSMNVNLPIPDDTHLIWPFWFVTILSLASALACLVLWRVRKW